MKRPVRTTVVFGLISALLVFPVMSLLAGYLGWSAALKLTLWADLALYSLLLVRWSGAGLLPLLFPLAILLGTALWPWRHTGFFLLALGILSWIRSGICFKAPGLRLLVAEIVAMMGGAALLAAWGPASPLTWALAVWLFFLVQSLYFYVMPGHHLQGDETSDMDLFEAASREVEKMIG